jgi:hypothetical protein
MPIINKQTNKQHLPNGMAQTGGMFHVVIPQKQMRAFRLAESHSKLPTLTMLARDFMSVELPLTLTSFCNRIAVVVKP